MRRRSLLSIHMVSSRVSHHALASLTLAGFGTVAFLDLDLELEKKWLANPFVSMAAQHAVLAYSFRMTDHEKCVGPMGKFTRSYLSTRPHSWCTSRAVHCSLRWRSGVRLPFASLHRRGRTRRWCISIAAMVRTTWRPWGAAVASLQSSASVQ